MAVQALEERRIQHLFLLARAAFTFAQQQKYVVGKARREIDVMQYQKRRPVGVSAVCYQHVHNPLSMVKVEVIGGFVE
jgi:hypothetical protein